MAAAEAVGGIGEPVLVKGAGQRDAGEHGQAGGDESGAAERFSDKKGHGNNAADACPDQRKGPA